MLDKDTEKILYGKWKNMEYRCTKEGHPRYKDYGGRGIEICEEWLDFDAFCKWSLESGYKDSLTIERIDNDNDYSPENCKWATTKEQGNNRRHVLEITIDGETKNAFEWCEIYDINYMTFLGRRNAYGWDDIKALTTPVKRRNPTGFKKNYR